MNATMTVDAVATWVLVPTHDRLGFVRTTVMAQDGTVAGSIRRYGGQGYYRYEAFGATHDGGMAAIGHNLTLQEAMDRVADWPNNPESRADFAGFCEDCRTALFDGGDWTTMTATDEDGSFTMTYCRSCQDEAEAQAWASR